jgi:hypothetical protein
LVGSRLIVIFRPAPCLQIAVSIDVSTAGERLGCDREGAGFTVAMGWWGRVNVTRRAHSSKRRRRELVLTKDLNVAISLVREEFRRVFGVLCLCGACRCSVLAGLSIVAQSMTQQIQTEIPFPKHSHDT